MTIIKPIDIDIRVYTALINQSGTTAPVATILHNTLNGNIIWTRDSTGIYIGTLTGAFAENTTAILINNQDSTKTLVGGYATANTIYLTQRDAVSPFNLTDVISNATIEIRVYK